jgi:hypothetical protein
MTNLAWIIYGAEIVGNFAAAFGVFLFIFGLATMFGFIAVGVTAHVDRTNSEEFQKAKIFLKIVGGVTGVILILGSFIPSKNTVLMIAAANYGDEIYRSDLKEIVDPAKKLLKQWVEDQLKEKRK